MMWAVTKVVIAMAVVVFSLQPIVEDMAGISLIKSLGGGGGYEPPQLTPSSVKHESVSKGRDYSGVKSNNGDVKKITSVVALPIAGGGGVWNGYIKATALVLKISALAVFLSLIFSGCKIRRKQQP